MKTELNISEPDGFYAALLAANEGLTTEQSDDFVLRLALILANQVGEHPVLLQAIAAAKQATRTRNS